VPLQQTMSLPLVDDFSVNIQIRIQQCGKEYQGYIQTDYSGWCSFPIQITPYDLNDLNTELQRAIECVSADFEANDAASTGYDEALSKLAQKGSFAFKKIFAKGTPRDVIHEALRIGAVIQVTTEDFFIPWELLYDGPLGSQTDASYFWGMRYIISRTLIREARPGDFMPPVIPPCPCVGLITCDTLEHVVGKEIPLLQEFKQQEQIILSCLRPLDYNQRDNELKDFGNFLNQELQIIHFACHAYEREILSESYLLVSNGFSVSMEDFDIQEFEIQHRPFVLLNVCLSGTINPFHTSNWAVLFWKHGARGVLATEFHVPDWFAASFMEEFYKHLLLKKPVGEALFLTRKYFWTQQKNPLGLGYALYSRPSIRIAG
jgi:CHAT domain